MGLESHIEALLFEHDCVIVPEFGGFVGNQEPGKLDELTGRFYPAHKRVTFNKNLNSNDGLLANAIRIQEDVTYEEALNLVREQVVEWKSALGNQGKLALGNVGKIFVDDENNWRFEQNKLINFLPASFGLDSIKTTPIERPVEKPVEVLEETPVIEFVPEEVETVSKKPLRVAKYALAAACILPLAFYSYWIPSETTALKRGYLKVSDFNPFKSSPIESKYHQLHRSEVVLEWDAISTSVSESVTLGEDHDARTFVVSSERPEPHANKSKGRFHLIGGCFRNAEYAQNRIQELRNAGYDSYEIDVKNGLHRICIQSFESKEAANTLKETLSNQGVDGWILTK